MRPQLHAFIAVAVVFAAGCSSSSDDAPTTDPTFPGSPTASAQIQAARDAADGTGLSLPIQGAHVTYVRPQIGVDAAGFFIQAEALGPALFVAVDPSTLAPVPAAGDEVDLTVTAMATVASRREATAITGWTRLATGATIGALQQDLSAAADLVSAVASYESELAGVSGLLRTDFAAAGSGFVAAGLDTAGVSTDPLLVFRLPTALRDALDLGLGCGVTVAATPLWRSDLTVQVTAWSAPDVTVLSCPAPRVLSALALSATTVRVTFDRALDAASVLADGSQFTFDGGLAATAAFASGAEVAVTTTAQAGGTSYTVSVASSVTNLYGSAVDPAYRQATFDGWVSPAALRLSEVNASVTGGGDLVELEVMLAGSMRDAVLQTGVGAPVVLATLPDVEVAAGDRVVVHLSPAAGVVTETTTKGDCTDAACYASAWDVAGAAQGINDTTRILAVKSALGVIQDAVPFTDGGTTGVPGTFVTDLEDLQLMGLWLPADCGGEVCSLSTTPTALEISASWAGMGATATGDSVRRTASADSDLAADWAVGPSSFGLAN